MARLPRLLLAALALLTTPAAFALNHDPFVSSSAGTGTFALVANGRAASLVTDEQDFKGVQHAVADLRADIERVTGLAPTISHNAMAGGRKVVIGTLGHNTYIDYLVTSRQLDVSGIGGRWEAFLIQNVDGTLIVAGSDMRGTIYGVYELSEQIGVSPWYWWADVPVKKSAELHVAATAAIVDDGPTVQYRGIFLNDEAPALTGWVHEKFGAFDHTFYPHVFELLLRLRANYLWPAMWLPRAFADDDPLNPELANEYGIVMGTSHHEPLMRAHAEWEKYGEGPWDYAQNEERLREFWRGGVERAKPYESIYTIAMRGDGDSAMSADTNTALLERIVADQRTLLAETLQAPAESIPQLWALYKEVQDYYEAGMRVPDDVILLWCDDNWGNLRRLPTPAEMNRSGGAGVYYHFDYVGGPRNTKWINITPISKVWEQLHLAWQHEANRIWIVNVGDLKPMEFPIEFFLTMAWDPAKMDLRALQGYTAKWAAREFGDAHADAIAALIDGYTKLNRHRTPEMMAPDTYSLVNYNEAARVLAQWRHLVELAESVHADLPEEARAAFFQLVLYPVKASATVRELHIASGQNALYAEQGRALAANQAAARARLMAAQDAELDAAYHALNDGKWNHLMDEKKFGYTFWQTPATEVLPPLVEARPNAGAEPALAVDGSPFGLPRWGAGPAVTPAIDVFSAATTWVEVFNRGDTAFTYTVTPDADWLQVEPARASVEDTVRLTIGADWSRVPVGTESARFTVATSAGPSFAVTVPIVNPADVRPGEFKGHIETNGYVAIEAPHFNRQVGANNVLWLTIPNFGRTLGGVASYPVRAPDETPGDASSRLEYDVFTRTTGDLQLEVHVAPSLDYQSGAGLRFAVSVDDGAPEILKLDVWGRNWDQAIGESIRKVRTTINLPEPGKHTIKVWRVTPGVVFERLILGNPASPRTRGVGVKPSYLGPPESPRGGM